MSRRIISNLIFTGVVVLIPLLASAQSVIDDIFARNGVLVTTFNLVIGLLFVLATVIFLWGVIQFIVKSGDEVARNKAKGIMTWGIIGLAVMAAAWGLVAILIQYFQVSGGTIPTGPLQQP